MTYLLWRIQGPVETATVKRRLNRFVLEVETGQGVEKGHLANPGELEGLIAPGSEVYCQPVDDETRKTSLDIIGAEAGDTLVYLPSADANRVVELIVERDLVTRFAEYSILEHEPAVGDETRMDFLAERRPSESDVIFEVKSVTHASDGVAKFPDRPTDRGRRQLQKLIDVVDSGGNAMLIFVVQRNDVESFEPYRDVDPEFADLLEKAVAAQVGVHALTLRYTGREIHLAERGVPISL